jgi:ankyrin repeat domain-containing protein 50
MLDDDDGGAQLPSVRGLNLKEGLLSEFKADLTKLEARLQGAVTRWRQLKEKLLWPLRERDVKDVLDSIHRLKGIVELGLIADTAASMVAIEKTTEALSDRIQEIWVWGRHASAQQELEVMLEWLGAPDPSVRHHEIRRQRAQNTGSWLLEGKAFQGWHNANSSFFWLHGIPGCGKCFLTSAVIDYVQRHRDSKPDAALACFYFDFSNDLVLKTESMLRSLVSQLSARKDGLPAALTQRAQELFSLVTGRRLTRDLLPAERPSQNGVAQPLLEDLVEILHGIIKESSHTYIVIDALDECADQDELLPVLNALFTAEEDGLCIFLASRHTWSIAEAIESKMAYVVKAGYEQVCGDIEQFVRCRVRNHPRLGRWPTKLADEIRQVLLEGAEGMFRWVICQLELLERCVTIRDVRKTLKGMPMSLFDTYTSCLGRIDSYHWEYAIKILLWLAASSKPLELEEAAEIVAIDLNAADGPVYDEDLRMPDASAILTIYRIRNWCRQQLRPNGATTSGNRSQKFDWHTTR